jgi:hypothetical protein
MTLGIEDEKEIAKLAERILRVYGKSGTPTLDWEIKRMARILNIPLREVITRG